MRDPLTDPPLVPSLTGTVEKNLVLAHCVPTDLIRFVLTFLTFWTGGRSTSHVSSHAGVFEILIERVDSGVVNAAARA